MGKTHRVEAGLWQRTVAMAMATLWLVVGVLPELHRHDTVSGHDSVPSDVLGHCHASGPTASTFFVLASQEATHLEVCGLCAKLSSFEGERPRAPLVGDLVGERVELLSSSKPPVFFGRHGAARAPPAV